MGEALSLPENQEGGEGRAKELSDPNGGAGSVPNEGVLLSRLIQSLSQRPRHSLLLSDLGALLPMPLRQRVKDQGGLRSWLQRYPSLFSVSGQPGKESVTLIIGGGPSAPGRDQEPPVPVEDVTRPSAANNQKGPDQASVVPGSSAVLAGCPAADAEDADGESAVQLRGLPYRATEQDVRAFLADFASKLVDDGPIHLVLNRDGRPSGFARVQFRSPEAARQCQDALHLKSMDDRYVEVFVYTERPSRGRQRRGVLEEGGPLPDGGEAAGGRGSSASDAPALSREQVVRECRAEMAEPKNRRLLLSMLGVALSPGARSYLKQMDQGLKHFLAQFPGEFSVEGGKGCEYVTYTPTLNLSEAIDGFNSGTASMGATAASSFSRAVGLSAPLRSGGTGPEPSSPKPAKTPPTDPTPSAGRGLATPSDWGTPSGPPCGSGPYLPPWPPAAGSNLAATGGEANATLWGAPSTWPMPPPQFWAGWPPTMYPPWGATAPPEAGSHALGTDAAGGYAAASPADAQGRAAAAGATVQASFAAPRVMGDAAASAGASPLLAAAVRLRGLPFTASEQDVLAFFAQHDIVDRISEGPKVVNLMLRSNGRPAGQAVVHMRDRSDAELAQRVLHGQWMGSRYIEVFLYGDSAADPNAAAALGTMVMATGPGTTQPAGQVHGAPQPWLPSQPWGASLPGAAQGGAIGVPDPTESSWAALFEFLGPEGALAAAAAGAGASLPAAGGVGVAAAIGAGANR
mmetsp:Transcript_47600/g.146659  ORF Transcript_47600/g.146659 Transcript_47600/m.146659 type:complete len:743 (+) Transcript_47600:112-2340(+)